MLIPFGIVLSTGIFFVFCAARRGHFGKSIEGTETPGFLPMGAPGVCGLSLLEQPCRWLAVKARNPALVQAALNLHHPMPCSWEEGLVGAREDKLFISPPVSGWVLVVGTILPEPAEDVDLCFRFLTSLSRKLGHIQFFSVNRVLSHHSWALIEKGRVFRGYAWTGAPVWNQGPLTGAEKDLEMACFPYASDTTLFTARDALAGNCEKISQLAGRWSVDPSAMSPSSWKACGIVGDLSNSKPS